MRTAPSRRDVLTSDLGHPKSPSGLPSQLDLDLLRVLSEFLTRWAFPPPVVAGWIGVDDDLLGAEPLIHEGGLFVAAYCVYLALLLVVRT
jgi:hypothetical protein